VTTPPTDTGEAPESDTGAPTDTDTVTDPTLGDTGPAFCYDCQSAAEVVGEPGGSPCSTSSGVAVGWAAAVVALAARRRQSPSQR
jgi:hypothetical protein